MCFIYNNMSYSIRPAVVQDMPAVHALIVELAVFEREPDAVTLTLEQLIDDGFGSETPRFHCFVAETEDGIAGMALVYPRYSTWKGKSLHLEDLIVKESKRGLGLGSALLSAVVRYGAQQGVARISWEVLSWNQSAIDFYESKGAKVLRDWHVVQLSTEGIHFFPHQS